MTQICTAMFGLSGLELTPDERDFFKDCEPWGFSLFARNLDSPNQVQALTASIRDALGRDVPIFIDQEGGRVQRLRPPHWRTVRPAADFGRLWDNDPDDAREAVNLNHQLMAHEMRHLGIDGDYAPCLDLFIDGAHEIIGDRSYGGDPEMVGALGRAALEGLNEQGVMGVVKHMPGHGRASVDSHFDLPIVDTSAQTLVETDFAAFKVLQDAPIGMTAHMVYTAIDPDQCTTFSSEIIGKVIRDQIGFDGLLMTDDLSMKALEGSFEDRCERSLAAGCDMLLHCNGEMHEMIKVASAAQTLDGERLRRADAALSTRGAPRYFDFEIALDRMAALFKQAGLEANV